MTKTNHEGNEKMQQAIRLREQRSEQWKREGERSLWRNLSMFGAFGWLIVTPILLGVLIGRWLDGVFDSGIFWSGAFIALGAAFGGYLVWKRIDRE